MALRLVGNRDGIDRVGLVRAEQIGDQVQVLWIDTDRYFEAKGAVELILDELADGTAFA